MSWWLVALIVLLVLVVLGSAAWAYQRATRLDRLHVRCELSWQALDAALARRAVVARAVAADAYQGGPEGRRLAGSRPRPNERPARVGRPPRTRFRWSWNTSTQLAFR